MSERNPYERGALWEKSSSRGTFFTVMIDVQPVVVFKNDRKVDGSNAPDWRVLKAKPRENSQRQERELDGDF